MSTRSSALHQYSWFCDLVTREFEFNMGLIFDIEIREVPSFTDGRQCSRIESLLKLLDLEIAKPYKDWFCQRYLVLGGDLIGWARTLN